jgi:hypothetical protein
MGTDTTTDPVKLVEGLDSATIQKRLRQIGAEEDALRVLLRAARARERAAARGKGGEPCPA